MIYLLQHNHKWNIWRTVSKIYIYIYFKIISDNNVRYELGQLMQKKCQNQRYKKYCMNQYCMNAEKTSEKEISLRQ